MMKGILNQDYESIDHRNYPKYTNVLVRDWYPDFYGPPTSKIYCCTIEGDDSERVDIPNEFVDIVEYEAQEHQYEDNNDGQKKMRYEVAKGILHDILTHKDVLEMLMGWTDGPDGDAPKESDIARISVNIANAFISKINE